MKKKQKDARQSRQIGGIKTQLKLLHKKIRQNDMHFNIALVIIIILGLVALR